MARFNTNVVVNDGAKGTSANKAKQKEYEAQMAADIASRNGASQYAQDIYKNTGGTKATYTPTTGGAYQAPSTYSNTASQLASQLSGSSTSANTYAAIKQDQSRAIEKAKANADAAVKNATSKARAIPNTTKTATTAVANPTPVIAPFVAKVAGALSRLGSNRQSDGDNSNTNIGNPTMSGKTGSEWLEFLTKPFQNDKSNKNTWIDTNPILPSDPLHDFYYYAGLPKSGNGNATTPKAPDTTKGGGAGDAGNNEDKTIPPTGGLNLGSLSADLYGAKGDYPIETINDLLRGTIDAIYSNKGNVDALYNDLYNSADQYVQDTQAANRQALNTLSDYQATNRSDLIKALLANRASGLNRAANIGAMAAEDTQIANQYANADQETYRNITDANLERLLAALKLRDVTSKETAYSTGNNILSNISDAYGQYLYGDAASRNNLAATLAAASIDANAQKYSADMYANAPAQQATANTGYDINQALLDIGSSDTLTRELAYAYLEASGMDMSKYRKAQNASKK